MIKQSTIDLLDATVDIVEVAELYVVLKKRGGTYEGLSPFNDEKTPSFKVSPSKNIWHDFSSGKGGRAINLPMEIEGLSFPETVEKLCDMYNITVEYEEGGKEQSVSSAPLEMYSEWCQKLLSKNFPILNYLKERGVQENTIKDFEIGFSPSSKEVVEFVKTSTMTDKEAIDLGIIDAGDNGLYGRFVNRIMFPIRNHNSKLCGFSGRTTVNHPAKYVNTKDTPLFNKSKIMYGFNLAKEYVSKQESFILSEGQMDIVLQHQAGFKNSFASMGTSLTKYHISILKRFAQKGVIAYDGDKAGLEATFRASKLLISEAIDARVVVLKDVDPADMIAQGNAKQYGEMLERGISSIKFCAEHIIGNYDISNAFDKDKAMTEIYNFSEDFKPIIKQEVINYAAKKIGVSSQANIEHIEADHKGITKHPNDLNPLVAAELQIIKAVIIDGSQEVIDNVTEAKQCFALREEVSALERLDFSNHKLTSILLNSSIISSSSVRKDLKHLKISCLKRFINTIKSSLRLSNIEKIHKIREAQMKINIIKKE